jgi:hypothetical protein
VTNITAGPFVSASLSPVGVPPSNLKVANVIITDNVVLCRPAQHVDPAVITDIATWLTAR